MTRKKAHRWSWLDDDRDECLDCAMILRTEGGIARYTSATGDLLVKLRIGQAGVPPCTGVHSARPIQYYSPEKTRSSG